MIFRGDAQLKIAFAAILRKCTLLPRKRATNAPLQAARSAGWGRFGGYRRGLSDGWVPFFPVGTMVPNDVVACASCRQNDTIMIGARDSISKVGYLLLGI